MKRRLAIEAVILIVAVAAFWSLIYSPWFDLACCATLEGAVLFAVFAAAYLGAVLTGGLPNPGRVHVLIGFLVEAFVLWAIVRLILRAWRARSGRIASGPGSG